MAAAFRLSAGDPGTCRRPSRRAHSVREAKAVLAERRPDLVLVDLDLPGVAALSLIDACSGTEVVAVLSPGSARLASAAMARGATSVLIKPAAVKEGAASARSAPHGVLSDQEMYVLLLVASGVPAAETGKILGLTVDVAKIMIGQIKKKFGVSRREHLVGEAFRSGILG